MSKIEQVCLRNICGKEGIEGSRVWMVSWNHSGTLLASCGEDKTVRIWKKINEEPFLECRSEIDDSHSRTVRCVNFSHCGKYLASASFDASIVIYTHENGDYSESNKLEGHESEVKWCAFSPSDEFLATCSRDKSVWFWQMDEDEDFQVSSIMQPHTQDVKFVTWHPSEELLVSCSYDYSIRFFKYDGEDWITQQKIDKAHDGTVWAASFDADGHRLVTVGEDRVVQIWRRTSPGKPAVNDTWLSVAKYVIEDSRWPLYSVSWSHGNGLIAVGGGDGRIRVFRVDQCDGEESITLYGSSDAHEGEVNCVAWNPCDYELLASCSDDGTIRLLQVLL